MANSPASGRHGEGPTACCTEYTKTGTRSSSCASTTAGRSTDPAEHLLTHPRRWSIPQRRPTPDGPEGGLRVRGVVGAHVTYRREPLLLGAARAEASAMLRIMTSAANDDEARWADACSLLDRAPTESASRRLDAGRVHVCAVDNLRRLLVQPMLRVPLQRESLGDLLPWVVAQVRSMAQPRPSSAVGTSFPVARSFRRHRSTTGSRRSAIS